MWPLDQIRAASSRRQASRKARQVARFTRARLDAAVTNTENARHWANADGLSADAAAPADVRQTLRNRPRYYVDKNS